MFNSILSLLEKLQTEMDCINFFIKQRWNGKVECPYKDCKHEGKVYEFKDGKRFQCSCCDRVFSYKTGTLFENTKIPLKKWFLAMYLHTSHKKGISSLQLAKDINVTQKTAWFMLQRIREIESNCGGGGFDKDSVVEIDECYMGGKYENMHTSKKETAPQKAVIIGMVERNSKQVKAMKIPTAEKDFLLPKINLNVESGATIVTDTYHAYNDLKQKYNHKTIKHSVKEYCRIEKHTAFKIHTNTIEGFWGLVQRGVNGIYHWVSKKHINRYLNEFSFRYNTNKMTDGERFVMSLTQTVGRLKYNDLIGKRMYV